MKKAFKVFLFILMTTGCSDFLNSKNQVPSSASGAQKKTVAQNPFPENYDPNAQEFSSSHMLANIGLNVIYPSVKDFRIQSETLEGKLREYCQVLATEDSFLTPEEKVKDQWKRAMLSYHQVDAIPMGPLSENGNLLRDHIYAWPSVSTCGLDVEVEALSKTHTPKDNLYVNVKGLAALEYLLFSSVANSKCPLASPRFAPIKAWLAKTEREKKKDRCEFAFHLTRDLVNRAQDLEDSWDPLKRNYSKSMADGRPEFSSVKEAVNKLSDALFAFEEIKDERLGGPLGLYKSCWVSGQPYKKCLDQIEHPWADMALEAMQARLESFKRAFYGSSYFSLHAYGFDDALKKMDRSDVALSLKQEIETFEAELIQAKSRGSFYNQVMAMDPGICHGAEASSHHVCRLFLEAKELSKLMLTDFLSALSLNAPPTYQGDND